MTNLKISVLKNRSYLKCYFSDETAIKDIKTVICVGFGNRVEVDLTWFKNETATTFCNRVFSELNAKGYQSIEIENFNIYSDIGDYLMFFSVQIVKTEDEIKIARATKKALASYRKYQKLVSLNFRNHRETGSKESYDVARGYMDARNRFYDILNLLGYDVTSLD